MRARVRRLSSAALVRGLVRGACVLGLLAAGCSSGSPTDGPAAPADAPLLGADEPEVVLPETAPSDLVVEDVVVGQGDEVGRGDTVTVHLVVRALSSGAEIDSTWDLAAPRRVPLVDGGAIEGLVRGLIGARVGGRRYLVVPPTLAYGSAGAPPRVGSSETLVFVVDVLELQRAG